MSNPTIEFTYADILENLEQRFIDRGREYWHARKVINFLTTKRGQVLNIEGSVRGSGGQIYHVEISVQRFGGSLGLVSIDGECSCPVGYDCKHVAAILIGALERRGVALEESTTKTGHAARSPITEWLEGIRHELDQQRDPDYLPEDEARRILYILRFKPYGYELRLELEFQTARLLKSGAYGKAKSYYPSRGYYADYPEYFTERDRNICQLFISNTRIGFDQRLGGLGSGELLMQILATGRCFFESKDDKPLVTGEERPLRMEWLADSSGAQHLTPILTPPAYQLLPVEPLYYLDLSSHECGQVASDVSPVLLEQLATAPPVAANEVQTMSKALASLPIELPKPLPVKRGPAVSAPQPILRLKAIPSGTDEPPCPSAWLSFDYAGNEVPAERDAEYLLRRDDACYLRSKRDKKAEADAFATLADQQLLPLVEQAKEAEGISPSLFTHDATDSASDTWLPFMLNEVPHLREQGWRVEIDEDFPLHFVEAEGWSAEVDHSIANPWFDIDLGIFVDQQRISLLPILLNMIQAMPETVSGKQLAEMAERERVPVPLGDGRILVLPGKRLAGILSVLVELYDDKVTLDDDKLRMSEWRATDLAELQDQLGDGQDKLEWRGGERLLKTARRLREFEGIREVELPAHFKADLRHYQHEGLNWLQFLREYELNGVLADDMGLGKTVQTLAHIVVEKAARRLTSPCLVVAPTSLMFNWRHEAERFAPKLKILTLHGPERSAFFDRIADYDLVLTTYPLLPRDEHALKEQHYHLLILDEAQQIKNPKAKAAQIVRGIKAKHRLCLTGTPMENHLGELWSLFHFLMPGILGDQKEFNKLFRTPIEKHADTDRARRLSRRIAPFLLRRTKEAVAAELPPKTEITRSVPLQGTQRDLYESIRLAMHRKVRQAISSKGVARSHIIILDALLKLRQACCDPSLVKLPAAAKVKHSAKLELLMEMLPELLEEGRRILLFSQFTSMLKIIEEQLDALGIPYVKLTGQTRDRQTPIQSFQDGEVPLFLISLKAGGTGLNLTAADTVIHYDPWWNPAVEAQATDRAHRIGQDKPVFVYRLFTEGTVEERIDELQQRKRELADGLFEAREGGKLPGAEELEELFAPLA